MVGEHTYRRAKSFLVAFTMVFIMFAIPPAESDVPVSSDIVEADDSRSGDLFGSSVAIEGGTLAVGARGDDDAGTDSGSVYIFERQTWGWMQVAELHATDASPGDALGWSIAIDNGTVVAGAPLRDGVATNTGAVYVFANDGTGWHQTAKLEPPGLAAGDGFGQSVAIDGDWIVAGAPFKDYAGSSSKPNYGAAYTFQGSGSSWTHTQTFLPTKLTITPPDEWIAPQFGTSVDIEGSNLAITGPGQDRRTSQADAGSGYVYSLDGSNWVKREVIQPFYYYDQHAMGSDVALMGDFIGIGAPALPVYNFNPSDWNTGGVYWLNWANWNGNRELEDRTILTADFYQSPERTAGARFGGSIAVGGNLLAIATEQGGSNGEVRVLTISSQGYGAELAKLQAPNGNWDTSPLSIDTDSNRVVVGLQAGSGARTNGGYAVIYDMNLPSRPRNVEAEAGTEPGTIEVTWSKPTYSGTAPVTGYDVYRGRESGGPYVHIASQSGLTFRDSGLTDDTYYYVITASNKHGSSQRSAEAVEKAFNPLLRLGVVDEYDISYYRSEAATGETPFGGARIKSPCPCMEPASPSVNLASGEFVASFPIMQMPSHRGADTEMHLTYRSIGRDDGNPSLAPDWHGSWLQYLETRDGALWLHSADGRLLKFQLAESGLYEGPPGTYATIATTGAAEYVLEDASGTKQTFNGIEFARLQSIVDRMGNAWTLHYTGQALTSIQDPHDRLVTFEYEDLTTSYDNPWWQTNGKPILNRVTSPDGQVARLRYDAAGLLAAIDTNRADGPGWSTTAFTYHNNTLDGITDNEGHPYLTIGYDEHGRVTYQDENDGSSLPHRHLFAYAAASGISIARDPNDNEVEWRFDHADLGQASTSSAPEPVIDSSEIGGVSVGSDGAQVDGVSVEGGDWQVADIRAVPRSQTQLTRDVRPLAIADPDSYVTEFVFNAEDELIEVALPKGNTIHYEYNESAPILHRGNMLSIANDRGSVSTAHMSSPNVVRVEFHYDPVHGLLTHMVESRGLDPANTPANGGSTSPERYTTSIFYDFHEAALGDLNGDGTTSLDAGMMVRIEYPTVNPTGSSIPGVFGSQYHQQERIETFRWNANGQIVWHQLPDGAINQYTYLASNGIPDDPADMEGFPWQVIEDVNGVAATTSYQYDSLGRLTDIIDPAGHLRTFVHDERNRIIQEVGPAPESLVTKWLYNANDQVVQTQRQLQPTGGEYASTTLVRDGLDRVTSSIADAARSPEIQAAVQSQSPPTVQLLTTQYRYDGVGNLVEVRRGDNAFQNWAYDERNLVYQESTPLGSTSYAYDANGNLELQIDAHGNARWLQHDGQDRFSSSIDARGTVAAHTYDAKGYETKTAVLSPLQSSVVPATRPTDATYGIWFQGATERQYEKSTSHDEAGRPYRTDEAHFSVHGNPRADSALSLGGSDLAVSLVEYDAMDRRVAMFDDEFGATRFFYDGLGRIVEEVDAAGNREMTIRDPIGNPERVIHEFVDALGLYADRVEVLHAHDGEGRRVQSTFDDGTTRNWKYDGLGNVIKETDELGNVVRTLHDRAGRPWVTIQELRVGGTGFGAIEGAVQTTTHWDGASQPVKRCDDNDHCTLYSYIGLEGKLTSERHPDGTAIWHDYDANGNRQATTFNNGREVAFGYDELNRLVEVAVSPDATIVGTTRQTFAYTPLGHVSRMTDNGITLAGPLSRPTPTTIVQEWDSLGNLVMESQNGQRVQYLRDGVGNIESIVYPNGRVVEQAHDGLGRLKNVEDAAGAIFTAAHEGASIVKETLGDPSQPVVELTISHDERRRVSHLEFDGTAGTLASIAIARDAGGHRIGHDWGPSASMDERLQLDSLYRNAAWSRGDSGGVPGNMVTVLDSMDWSADGANNWLTTNRNGVQCTRTHGDANQLLSETCAGQARALAYDQNGNLAYDGDYRYYYDFLNRLVRVDEVGELVDTPFLVFGYDPLGRRIVKVANESLDLGILRVDVSQDTFYTYSGPSLIQESRLIEWHAEMPQVMVVRQWTHGDNIDKVLEMSVDRNANGATTDVEDERYFYMFDDRHSVIGLVDEAGSLVEGYSYDPFGHPTIRLPGTGSDVRWDGSDRLQADSVYGNPFLFTGRFWDDHIDMYHFRARTYDSESGRFLSRDPLGAWGDLENLGNAYAYVGNSPWQFTDPFGMESLLEKWGGKNDWVCNGVTNFIPGIGTGCAAVEAAEDYAQDDALCNTGGGMDKTLCWANAGSIGLDLVPGGTLARAGVKAAASGAGFIADAGKAGRAAENAAHALRGTDEVGAAAKAGGGAKLDVPTNRMQHVLDRHIAGGPHSAGASIFRSADNLDDVARGAMNTPYYTAGNGLRVRAYDTGTTIGLDAVRGYDTQWVTVVTKPRPGGGESLWTMHPGWPRGV